MIVTLKSSFVEYRNSYGFLRLMFSRIQPAINDNDKKGRSLNGTQANSNGLGVLGFLIAMHLYPSLLTQIFVGPKIK